MTIPTSPERTRRFIDRCAGCGHCRDLMDEASYPMRSDAYRRFRPAAPQSLAPAVQTVAE